ncbi:MAG: FecR protein, partial [Candidatus Rokuibacteriota bacterium]
MATNAKWLIVTLPALALLLATASSARAAAPPSQPGAIGRTPPRLSYINGEVSFWRPGAQDWTTGQVNTPLAPGDELYTATQGDLELEAGTRAFVRAWGDTRLGLANQEPDFLQFTIPSGHLSVDLRGLGPGHSVELDTPNAAFTIEQPGYYRVDVTPERTSFITRRGGRATMRPATGQAVAIVPSEEVVLEGETVQSYVAPELDVWDQWNYARTDHLLESVSARYVPPDVYGVDDLDHYGTWRVVQTYGPVWVPEAVTPGWVPYSTGRWISDPHYGWTWVDTAPWGWAPYHYGRWVVVDGFWAWAPGPVVARPVYCPALVAFFGAPGIVVSAGAPVVSWVALSWGEPVVPWWGPAGFVGRPRWAGWGGPRVVNNVVINRTTVVNVNNITVYKNVTVQNSVVAVRQDHFGARPVEEARIAQVDVHRLQPVHGPLRVAPEAASFVAASGRAARPPETMRARPVVATRPLAGRVGATRNEVRQESPTVS